LHGRNIELPTPPVCAVKPDVKVNVHGDEVVDNYSWLKDKENEEGTTPQQNVLISSALIIA